MELVPYALLGVLATVLISLPLPVLAGLLAVLSLVLAAVLVALAWTLASAGVRLLIRRAT